MFRKRSSLWAGLQAAEPGKLNSEQRPVYTRAPLMCHRVQAQAAATAKQTKSLSCNLNCRASSKEVTLEGGSSHEGLLVDAALQWESVNLD